MSEKAQMTVEMAIIMPVVLVTIFIVFNLMLFVEACGDFDNISRQAILLYAGQRHNKAEDSAIVSSIKSYIEDNLSCGGNYEVEVDEIKLNYLGKESSPYTLISPLSNYKCTLKYFPITKSFSVAGFEFRPPYYLEHTTRLVVP